MTLEKAANKVLTRCYKDTDVVLIQDIKRWSSERDYAIHEIAKVHSSNQMDWDERMLINEEIAREGLELVPKAKNFAK
jgi:DNA-binding transcriptional MerR regulator